MPHDIDWEFWLDNQLSPIIAKWMSEETGLIFKSAYTQKFYEISDIEIYQSAKQQGNVVIVSKDVDFSQLIARYGSPPKLIHLQIPNCDNRIMFNFLLSNFEEIITSLFVNNINIVELALR
ncbi:MAG TPA: DUF5615 family PIN-like protein [Puia sp.]|jgi:predicted nuclease of predicted toxin-antitoxin system|nr:DUF5615 family PIN-like protein [Puia sp.]